MKCPACAYMMSAFDTICPRCQGKGLPPAPAGSGGSGTKSASNAANVTAAPSSAGASMPCPYCSEPILATAKKCRHCNEWLEKAQGRAGTLYGGTADARATAKGMKKFERDKQIVMSATFFLIMMATGFILWVEANYGEEARNYAFYTILPILLVITWFLQRWYDRE